MLNRNALKIIPESLNFGPVEYFEYLASGTDFDESDRSIVEKLKRRIENKRKALTPEEVAAIHDIVVHETLKDDPSWALLTEWMALPESKQFPDPMKERGGLFARMVDIRRELASVRDDPKRYRKIPLDASTVVRLKVLLKNQVSHQVPSESYFPVLDGFIRMGGRAKELALETLAESPQQTANTVFHSIRYDPLAVGPVLIAALKGNEKWRLALREFFAEDIAADLW